MKIALVLPNNLFSAPYLQYYTRLLDDNSISYDIINWDRAGKNEPDCISYQSKEQSRKAWALLLQFLKFRKFVKSKMAEENYDKVVVFTCQIAILLSGVLIKQFKGNYILDIRDYSKVIPVFKSRFNKVLKHAQLICISSQGFRSWLPEKLSYIISHNISSDRLQEKNTKRLFFQNQKINVDTIGALRDPESNGKIVDALKNNAGFHMKFIGDGYALPFLKKQAEEENISNIHFHGYYNKEDEFELLKTTDFINIVVGNDFLSKSLTSNRLYLCALLHIPAIVNHETEQSRIIKKYGFGVVVNNYQKLSEVLLNYRKTFNEQIFISNCNKFLNDVKNDQLIFESRVLDFFQNL